MIIKLLKIIVFLVLALLFLLSLNNLIFNQKEKNLAGIKIASNPEHPIQGKRRFIILDKKVLDRKFNLVSVDMDSEDNLFILEIKEKKILKYSPEGVFQAIIGDNMFIEPDFLLIDCNNLIYVSDRKSIHIFSADGNYYKRLNFPFYIGEFAVTKKNLILIENSSWKSGRFNWKLELYDLDGNHIKTLFETQENAPAIKYKFPSFFHPKLLVRQNKNLTLFAFTADYKLYVVDENGDIKLIIEKKEKPLPVTEKEIKELSANKDSLWIPRNKPLFYDIFIDDEDKIYVEKWPGGQPSLESRYLDCFDRDGRFLFIINDLPRVVLIKIQKDRLVTAEPIKGSPYMQVSILRYSLVK